MESLSEMERQQQDRGGQGAKTATTATAAPVRLDGEGLFEMRMRPRPRMTSSWARDSRLGPRPEEANRTDSSWRRSNRPAGTHTALTDL